MRNLFVPLAIFCSCALFPVGMALAEVDKGPENIILRSTIDPAKTPKPATFPHGEHQGRLECAHCHHSKAEDGSRVAYVEGQEIGKCESCHNSQAEGMNAEYNTFQKAGHGLCRTCHQQTDAQLAKCTVCHKKE